MSKWFEMIGENDWMGRTMMSMVKKCEWMITSGHFIKQPRPRASKIRTSGAWKAGRFWGSQVVRGRWKWQQWIEAQAGWPHKSPWISPARPTWEFGIATNNWCLGPASMVSQENLKSYDSYGVFATSRFGQQAPAKQNWNSLACLWAYSCQLNMTVSGPNPRLAMTSCHQAPVITRILPSLHDEVCVLDEK